MDRALAAKNVNGITIPAIKMSYHIIFLPTIEQIEFTIECLPENMPIKGHYIRSGDDELDRTEENKIRRQLNAGNQWAWCHIRLIARYKSLTAVDRLGECSYKDELDFKNDGYFEEMKQNTFDAIIAQLKAL